MSSPDPFDIPDESKEERAAAIEDGMPDVPEPEPEPEPTPETTAEVEEAVTTIADPPAPEPPSAPKAVTAPTESEDHERGLRGEITKLRDQKTQSESGLQSEIEALKAQVSTLQQTTVPRETEEEGPDGIELEPDSEGRIVINEETLAKIRQGAVEDMRRASEPTIEQKRHTAAAENFQRMEATFIAENPALHMPAASRVREMADRVNLMSELLSLKEGGVDPGSARDWITLFEKHGADKELESLYPDMGEFGAFCHAVFDPNPYGLATYWMPSYVERLVGVLTGGGESGVQAPSTPKVEPVEGMQAPKKLGVNRPRSIGNQGEGNRASYDDLEAKLVAMHKIDPFDLTDEQTIEMAEIENQLEKEHRVG